MMVILDVYTQIRQSWSISKEILNRYLPKAPMKRKIRFSILSMRQGTRFYALDLPE